jgi:hypothetical protein
MDAEQAAKQQRAWIARAARGHWPGDDTMMLVQYFYDEIENLKREVAGLKQKLSETQTSSFEKYKVYDL